MTTHCGTAGRIDEPAAALPAFPSGPDVWIEIDTEALARPAKPAGKE